ncbi:hypothetical protein SASPL_106115 [Salvia splendens]|uniref:Uncharacterized protein n=2 Tax=Salvia splendens TaxID=180675 RepID=A0A8X8YRU1_SALSN|nr:uncharacterized protein LOC121765759 isoform X1 [Salvia splendens]KAG6434478.1 hypothetical protein SASPL_106115 [Salvia splendens]
MGGGFMFSANSASASPPFPAARSFQTPAVCTELQPCYCSDNDSFLGPVPSRVEVESAILQLQRFMRDQMHHHLHLQSPGFTKFSEAFAMMQAEPPLQNLVTSISCDEAVWKAMLSNKAVGDLRGSISAAKEEKLVSYLEKAKAEPALADVMLKWILDLAKSKVMQLLESFASLVNDIFQPPSNENPTSQLDDLLDEKLRSSLLLSVVILLIVVVVRGQQ